MPHWAATLILRLIPVSVAVIAWLLMAGIERGLRLRLALAVFVAAFLGLLVVSLRTAIE
jgi:hypothetical protein